MVCQQKMWSLFIMYSPSTAVCLSHTYILSQAGIISHQQVWSVTSWYSLSPVDMVCYSRYKTDIWIFLLSCHLDFFFCINKCFSNLCHTYMCSYVGRKFVIKILVSCILVWSITSRRDLSPVGWACH